MVSTLPLWLVGVLLVLVEAFVLGVVADRIYVSFRPVRVVSGLLIHGGRVVYAGDAGVVERVVGVVGGTVRDYGKRVVMPGFIDSHIHVDGLCLQRIALDLRGARSVGEILRAVAEKARSTGVGVIVGRGWDQDKLAEKRPPTRRELDMAAGGKPVLLIRVCGHAAVANTQALLLAGKNPESQRYSGGALLEEEVREAMEALGVGEQALKEAAAVQRELASMGVTRVGWVSAGIQHIGVERVIGVRLYLEPRSFMEWAGLGLPPGALGVDGVKAILDGSLGARTALLSSPYSDEPGEVGRANYSPQELEQLALEARCRGYGVAVHAIGDRALDILLSVYSGVGLKGGRIEHASIIRDDQIPAIKRLSARVVIQPGFILSDTWILDRLGPERIRWAYRIRSLVEQGIIVGFSSDAPVEPPNPWRTIYAAVTRGENEGLDIAAYTRDEKVDAATALHLHTRGSAQTLGLEDAGCLEQGCLGDYIVVDRDPLRLEPEKLARIRVEETWVEGRRLYP